MCTVHAWTQGGSEDPKMDEAAGGCCVVQLVSLQQLGQRDCTHLEEVGNTAEPNIVAAKEGSSAVKDERRVVLVPVPLSREQELTETDIEARDTHTC